MYCKQLTETRLYEDYACMTLIVFGMERPANNDMRQECRGLVFIQEAVIIISISQHPNAVVRGII